MNTEKWKLTEGGGMVIDAMHVTDNQEKEIFAVIPFGPNCGNKEQAIKRGKVMAAAPELLDAIEGLMIGLMETSTPAGSIVNVGLQIETISKAKAAIKKATE
jgi:hypothetical protein